MKLENKSDYTINFTRKALNTISKYADLEKPEEVRARMLMKMTMQMSDLDLDTRTRIIKELMEQFPQAKQILKDWVDSVSKLF